APGSDACAVGPARCGREGARSGASAMMRPALRLAGRPVTHRERTATIRARPVPRRAIRASFVRVKFWGQTPDRAKLGSDPGSGRIGVRPRARAGGDGPVTHVRRTLSASQHRPVTYHARSVLPRATRDWSVAV